MVIGPRLLVAAQPSCTAAASRARFVDVQPGPVQTRKQLPRMATNAGWCRPTSSVGRPGYGLEGGRLLRIGRASDSRNPTTGPGHCYFQWRPWLCQLPTLFYSPRGPRTWREIRDVEILSGYATSRPSPRNAGSRILTGSSVHPRPINQNWGRGRGRRRGRLSKRMRIR